MKKIAKKNAKVNAGGGELRRNSRAAKVKVDYFDEDDDNEEKERCEAILNPNIE